MGLIIADETSQENKPKPHVCPLPYLLYKLNEKEGRRRIRKEMRRIYPGVLSAERCWMHRSSYDEGGKLPPVGSFYDCEECGKKWIVYQHSSSYYWQKISGRKFDRLTRKILKGTT